MAQIISTLALIALLIGVAYSYEKAKADYDPEAICAAQKDVSREQCLSAIDFAMSAGW
jgi:hypothetical protein